MSDPAPGTPLGLIQSVLRCDKATAESVQARLASVIEDRNTRAFVARAWHLTTTTHRIGGRDDGDMLVNEGKRQCALFMVACARRGLELDTFETEITP